MPDRTPDPHPRRLRPGSLVRVAAILAVVAFVALLAYGLAAQAPNRTIDDQLARRRPVAAPGFALELLDQGSPPKRLKAVVARAVADGRVALRELRGTPVVLNFWASWCDPCRTEAPILERGWRDAGREGVVFLGVDIQDVREDARNFLRELSVSYPTIREPGKDTARSYGATGIPETYFISARGQVVGHVLGVVTRGQLRRGVAAARLGRPSRLGAGGAQRSTR